MGYAAAFDTAQTTENPDLALEWHLRSNHFPPLPLSIIPAAKAAIEAAVEGDWMREIELPEGIYYHGISKASVYACISAWHLQAFIDALSEDGDYDEEEQD